MAGKVSSTPCVYLPINKVQQIVNICQQANKYANECNSMNCTCSSVNKENRNTYISVFLYLERLCFLFSFRNKIINPSVLSTPVHLTLSKIRIRFQTKAFYETYIIRNFLIIISANV